jgi:glucosamine-phosphate N-acetyltransferase
MLSKENINFLVREIQQGDLHKGFLETLSNLAEIGTLTEDNKRADKILSEIKSSPFYKIFVAVNDNGQIIGSITLLIEQKFIHDGAKVGHIEDVTTSKKYEGKGVGTALVHKALDYAKENNCYKVILDCSRRNIQFYQRIGFREHDTSMRYDIRRSC